MSGRVFHAPFIQHHPGFRLAGCWERTSKLIKQQYPAATSYDTLDELLADTTIDTRGRQYADPDPFRICPKSIAQGKHVLVEKAFAGNAAEAVELRALAEQHRSKLAVFQNNRQAANGHDFCPFVTYSSREHIGQHQLKQILPTHGTTPS